MSQDPAGPEGSEYIFPRLEDNVWKSGMVEAVREGVLEEAWVNLVV